MEISAAKWGEVVRLWFWDPAVVTSANGSEQHTDLQDVYYALEIHARLVSLRKLKRQGWDISLRDNKMELHDRDGDLFTEIAARNDVYLARLSIIPPKTALATWMTNVLQRSLWLPW